MPPRWAAVEWMPGRVGRHLLLDGPPGAEPPGAREHRMRPHDGGVVEAPFGFERMKEALDWADAVVLSGFLVHRQNLLGPAQLRPVLASAREQVEAVVLSTTHDKRLAMGRSSGWRAGPRA